MKSFLAAAGVIAIASAQGFTKPGAQTYGALFSPDTTTPVTTGQQFTVKWTPNQPATGVKVSLVLCSGPSSNCVLQNTAIASGLDASAGQYVWNVPCSLPAVASTSTTGNGMLIIVDGTGEFQYSTQFSVVAGSSCGSSGSTTSSSSTTSAPSSTSSTGSVTTSASGMPTSYTTTQGYYGWSTVSNSTIPAPQTWSASTLTSTAAPQTTTAAAVTTKANPSTFTGAAAIPTAFVNAVGVMGAAGLAIFAL